MKITYALHLASRISHRLVDEHSDELAYEIGLKTPRLVNSILKYIKKIAVLHNNAEIIQKIDSYDTVQDKS